MDESPNQAPPCVKCGYNLTELTSDRCPECGWNIDWDLARQMDPARRSGTPVNRAQGWRRILAIPATLLLMLFRPVSFAKCLREDEPIWPAVLVAILAYAVTFVPAFYSARQPIQWLTCYAGAIIACILVNTTGFTLLTRNDQNSISRLKELRWFGLFSLYSTCFVAAWGLSGPPTMEKWNEANFFWLAKSSLNPGDRLEFCERTLVVYWWVLILVVAALVRSRSRWRAALFIPVPFVATWLATQIGFQLANVLELK